MITLSFKTKGMSTEVHFFLTKRWWTDIKISAIKLKLMDFKETCSSSANSDQFKDNEMRGSCSTHREMRNAYKIVTGKITRRRKDNIKMHLTEVGCIGVDWIKPTHDSVQWWDLEKDGTFGFHKRRRNSISWVNGFSWSHLFLGLTRRRFLYAYPFPMLQIKSLDRKICSKHLRYLIPSMKIKFSSFCAHFNLTTSICGFEQYKL